MEMLTCPINPQSRNQGRWLKLGLPVNSVSLTALMMMMVMKRRLSMKEPTDLVV